MGVIKVLVRCGCISRCTERIHRMKTRWTIGKKLSAAFVGVSLITLVLGSVGYYSAVRSQGSIDEIGGVRLSSVDSLAIIKENSENIRGTFRTLSITGLSVEVRKRQYDNIAESRKEYEAAWKIYEQLPQTQEEAQTWKQFVPAWNAWRAENNKAMQLSQQVDQLLSAYEKSERSKRQPYGDALGESETRILETLASFELQLREWKNLLLRGRDPEQFKQYWAAFEKQEQAVQASIKKIQEMVLDLGLDAEAVAALSAAHVKLGSQYRAAIKKYDRNDPSTGLTVDGLVARLARPVNEVFDTLLEKVRKAKHQQDESNGRLRAQLLGPVTVKQRAAIDLLDKVVQINRDGVAHETSAARTQAVFSKIVAMSGMIIGVLLALALGVLVTRSINRSLRHVIEGLSDGAQEVAAAAGQVSSAAQSLAEGSSEQAASLEETSSSIEEMSSMTSRNADNAGQANAMMEKAKEVVRTANDSMSRLTGSMGEIARASEETSRIIKTIDEIAFQTNLLALNAAVEAARAGEAGAGFAVVADEVRNLAMRAAEAAKNTSNLIEGTVQKVKDGSDLVNSTNEAFKQVTGSSTKAGDLVAEISAASTEQAQGIGQINTAVTELDKVTQQNAANAEESASAAEEMSAQAETMKGMVDELVAIVGSSGKGRKEEYGKAQASKPKVRLHHTLASAVQKVKSKSGSARKPAKPIPEAVIPLDDDKQFSDF
jgi:ABC-type transporter Mla subunit MlaD